MATTNGEPPVRLGYGDLVERLRPVFERHGCPPGVARLLAQNCAAAERDGAASHGLFRLRQYVSTLRVPGWVDPAATPLVEEAAPGFLRIDARNGFAVPALSAGRDLALVKARTNGAVVVAIRNSHHLGALSLDVEPFADEGLVALSFINTMRSVVPHGGRRAVLGTNPIAFAAPRAGGPPLVLDMATAAMAHGEVQVAAREGRTLASGVGVDRNGQATTDPQAVLDGGALLAFGGHKGAALALVVEILCAALGGGAFSDDVVLSDHPGASTPRTGQTFVLVDPDAGRGALSPFAAMVEDLLGRVAEAGQNRLPGSRRHAARAHAAREGIAVPAALVRDIEALAQGHHP